MKRILVCVALASAATFVTLDAGAQNAAPAPAEAVRETPESGKTDPAKTAAQVTTALENSKGVPAKDISVTTHAGTVVLNGEVNSEAESARATAVAEGAADGARVSSQLEVKPLEKQAAAQQKSAQLVKNVEAALKSDARTANLGVAVSVDERHVIGLHGLVPSKESRTAAENVAARASGTATVKSHLVVPAE